MSYSRQISHLRLPERYSSTSCCLNSSVYLRDFLRCFGSVIMSAPLCIYYRLYDLKKSVQLIVAYPLQDKLRAEASYGFECYFKEQLAEKKKGRNHDLSVTEYKVAQESRKLADIKQQNNEEQEKNTKLRSNNASISYQIATQEQRHSRNLDVIAADEDRLETVRSSINAAETEYAKYEDMITDKKNNLELLSSKESELIERTKIAENVYDMFRQGGTDDVREKLIDVMYENQKLREENTTLKELLEKAYEFMKQFVIDGVNLLERFLESVGKAIGKDKVILPKCK